MRSFRESLSCGLLCSRVQGVLTLDHRSKLALKLLVLAFASIGVVFALRSSSPWIYAYNGTQSLFAGTGLYRYEKWSDGHFSRGDIVAARFVYPEWVESRPWWEKSGPDLLFKRIAAVPGDHLKVTSGKLYVCPQDSDQCSLAAVRRNADSRGLSFPPIDLPEVVPDEYFLLLADHPMSFDSRYVGLFQRSTILGRAEPYWVKPIPEELKTVEGIEELQRAGMTKQELDLRRGQQSKSPLPEGGTPSHASESDSPHYPKGNDSAFLTHGVLTHGFNSSASERQRASALSFLTHALTQTPTQEGFQGLTQSRNDLRSSHV